MLKGQIVGVLLLSSILSSCCSRPYLGGVMTWPRRDYNVGPDIETSVSIRIIQRGICPSPDARNLKVLMQIEDKSYQKIQRFEFLVVSDFGGVDVEWKTKGEIQLADDRHRVFAVLQRDESGKWTVQKENL